ncbi:MAG: 3'(2'),5'-bisphosphate nucleotidase CysQ [Verrucomicrobia bacterium]|nr:3'(2'),5'-bisphosphate nucleotidase CysQ [Verrucomicrobiota bacterium]
MKGITFKLLALLMALPASSFSSLTQNQSAFSFHDHSSPDISNIPSSIASSEFAHEMQVALLTARLAGIVLLQIQRSGEDLQVEEKEGYNYLLSPVTIADMRANLLICRALNAAFPDDGILSEEKVQDPALEHAVSQWQTLERVWIIDPLDGTQDFINKGHEYGVHIGLSMNGKSVLGVNYYPELDLAYYAVKGYGAYKQSGSAPATELRTRPSGAEILPIRNTDPKETAQIYQELFQREITPEVVQEMFFAIGSCGMRICSIVERRRNLYVSTAARGGLWDYCSSDVIIREAGGFISDMNGNPIDYCDESSRLKHGTVVSNDRVLFEKVLEIKRNLDKQNLIVQRT